MMQLRIYIEYHYGRGMEYGSTNDMCIYAFQRIMKNIGVIDGNYKFSDKIKNDLIKMHSRCFITLYDDSNTQRGSAGTFLEVDNLSDAIKISTDIIMLNDRYRNVNIEDVKSFKCEVSIPYAVEEMKDEYAYEANTGIYCSVLINNKLFDAILFPSEISDKTTFSEIKEVIEAKMDIRLPPNVTGSLEKYIKQFKLSSRSIHFRDFVKYCSKYEAPRTTAKFSLIK